MAEPNADLIRRAQAGDRDALGELVIGQQRYVYSIALSLMRSPADAADIAQEAFLRVIRGVSSYRGETRFNTWLYRLVVNVGLDELRRRGRPVDSLEAEAVSTGLEVPDVSLPPDPLAQMTREEAAQQVREAVEALPAAQRLALTMHYFEDMGYEAIAEVMGVPLNTVKSHIRRGKQRLAWTLREYAPSAMPLPSALREIEGGRPASPLSPPPARGGTEGGRPPSFHSLPPACGGTEGGRPPSFHSLPPACGGTEGGRSPEELDDRLALKAGTPGVGVRRR